MENSRCMYYVFTERNYTGDSQQIVAEVALSEALGMERAGKCFLRESQER